MDSKLGQIIVVGLLSVLTIGSISVTGLLQSSNRIDTTGIIVRPVSLPAENITEPQLSLTPPPPEPKIDVDVYSNQACTQEMSSVAWGEIVAGEESEAKIYAKNNGDVAVVLSLITENWSSNMVKNNMNLSWDYDGSSIQPGDIVPITLTLSVNQDCEALSSFSFDIIIVAS